MSLTEKNRIMTKEKALEILDVFYGQPDRFCSLHLEGKAVKALGGIKKALPYIRRIVEKAGLTLT